MVFSKLNLIIFDRFTEIVGGLETILKLMQMLQAIDSNLKYLPRLMQYHLMFCLLIFQMLLGTNLHRCDIQQQFL